MYLLTSSNCFSVGSEEEMNRRERDVLEQEMKKGGSGDSEEEMKRAVLLAEN